MARLISGVVKPGAAVAVIGAAAVGLGIVGSAGGVDAWSLRLFAVCGITIFVTSWIGYGASLVVGDDRFVEIGRPLTYLTTTAVLLIGHPDLNSRVVTIAVLVEVWAIGAGVTIVLSRRFARATGTSFVRGSRRSSSLRVWTFYALIAYTTVGAGFVAATSTDPASFGPFSAIGIGLFSLGFSVMSVATRQRLKAVKAAEFASTGLWQRTRHPDLFGEVIIWLGITVVAFPALEGWRYLTMVSPIVVYALSVRVLAIPRAESKAEHQFASSRAFNFYTANTPTFWPRTRR